jgi:predicted xylose isomerase-like sugar epimerase
LERLGLGESEGRKLKSRGAQGKGLGLLAEGDFSFEPFSPAIQKLSRDKLAEAVRQSIEFILA